MVSVLRNLNPDVLGPLENCSPSNPEIEIHEDDIGTLSFTSGSTGRPKGIWVYPFFFCLLNYW